MVVDHATKVDIAHLRAGNWENKEKSGTSHSLLGEAISRVNDAAAGASQAAGQGAGAAADVDFRSQVATKAAQSPRLEYVPPAQQVEMPDATTFTGNSI